MFIGCPDRRKIRAATSEKDTVLIFPRNFVPLPRFRRPTENYTLPCCLSQRHRVGSVPLRPHVNQPDEAAAHTAMRHS